MEHIATSAVIDLVLSLVIAVLYGAVAWAVANRHVSAGARVANVSFATWWWALVVVTVLGVAWTLLYWIAEPSLALWWAYLVLLLLLIFVAFAALLYYFLFLWSGRNSLWVPIGLFYLAVFVFFVWYIAVQEPSGFDATGEIVYANDLADSPLATAVSALWLLPTIIGAGLYLSLLRKVPHRMQRFRIGLVASSIIVWFLLIITSSLSDVGDATWWTYVSRLLSATVATLTLIAYRPPTWLRDWMRLDELENGGLPPEELDVDA